MVGDYWISLLSVVRCSRLLDVTFSQEDQFVSGAGVEWQLMSFQFFTDFLLDVISHIQVNHF